VVGGRVEVMCQVGLLFSGQRPPPGFVGRALILQSACDSPGPVFAGYLYAVDNCILPQMCLCVKQQHKVAL
jgi:hypothetical protein